ncbi:MAG: prephenate dehydrogenase [Bacteriovoracaceae bacterium]
MNVVIVGLGLIGGSLAIDLRANGFAKKIIGVEQSEEHCTLARYRGLVDDILPLSSALKQADVVILAVPVNYIIKLLPTILDQVASHTTVLDMGSTKNEICNSVKDHPKRKQFVPTHPMAGTEFSGPTAAQRNLFFNRTAVICDPQNSDPEHLRVVDKIFELLQTRKTYMSSVEHDLHTAYISHLSHISSFVLANTVLDKEKNVGTIFDLAGGGFDSTVRLAKSSPDTWAPIFEQNHKYIIEALATYIKKLQHFQTTLEQHNFDETKELMKHANGIKRILKNINSPQGKQA